MNPTVLQLARQLHRLPVLRKIAKLVARRRVIVQPFHGGVIGMDAVEHSWAWTGDRTLESFDRAVQDQLLELMPSRPHLIDIGSNLGVMTLSTLLRHPSATAVAVDPNRRAIELLQGSLRRNGLQARARTLLAAVSAAGESLHYDSSGSFTGHVAENGAPVAAIPLLQLLAQHGAPRMVIKLDIEGYEAVLAPVLQQMPPQPGCALVIELHPLGFNGLGDPRRVITALQSRGDLTVRLFRNEPLATLDPTQFHHVVALWTA